MIILPLFEIGNHVNNSSVKLMENGNKLFRSNSQPKVNTNEKKYVRSYRKAGKTLIINTIQYALRFTRAAYGI